MGTLDESSSTLAQRIAGQSFASFEFTASISLSVDHIQVRGRIPTLSVGTLDDIRVTIFNASDFNGNTGTSLGSAIFTPSSGESWSSSWSTASFDLSGASVDLTASSSYTIVVANTSVLGALDIATGDGSLGSTHTSGLAVSVSEGLLVNGNNYTVSLSGLSGDLGFQLIDNPEPTHFARGLGVASLVWLVVARIRNRKSEGQ